MIFNWFGDRQLRRIEEATKRGIDKSSSQGTKVAKQEVHVDTTLLQGSIFPESSKKIGTEIAGQFGTHDIDYAIPQEFDPIRGKPYMRPGKKEAKDNLKANIKEEYDKL